MITSAGCKKYLDQKSDKTLVIPTSIADAQALLDNGYQMISNYISDATICDDNYWITDAYFLSRPATVQNEYLWTNDAQIGESNWQYAYRAVLYANTALETLEKISPASEDLNSYNLAKGMALVYRAMEHHAMIINMCLQYDSNTASTILGIPYKKTSDINDATFRPKLESNFHDIIVDLKNAAGILPTTTSYPTRPTKAAAFGALARVYISMADYQNALLYADSSLQLNNQLIDFNTIDTSSSTPFNRFNIEVLFHIMGSANRILLYPNWNCDSNLYKTYETNDLRKYCFFRKNTNGENNYSFKGTYDQSSTACNYIGITTDEMLITRSECLARTGKNELALDDLNTLLKSRYKNSSFIPYTISNAGDVMNLILRERRKELVGRGNLRWMDLKRLNLEPKYAKTITRICRGESFSLPPNDNRYALLIPPSVILQTGMAQNPR